MINLSRNGHHRILLSNVLKFSSENKPDLKLSESCTKVLKDLCKDGSFLRVTVEVR